MLKLYMDKVYIEKYLKYKSKKMILLQLTLILFGLIKLNVITLHNLKYVS
jgi:hypothetical protein